jgi:DNA-directed RNA polymerase sigma subunit (sigma70/sigma32)
MRSGIGMNTEHTLKEVGQQFSVTRGEPPARRLDRQGIRQIEAPGAAEGEAPVAVAEAAELLG